VVPYALVAIFLMFFIRGPGYYAPRHLNTLWNLGHIVFFALLPFAVSSYLERRLESFWSQCMLVVATSVGLGTIIEIVQYGLRIDVDLGDIFRDVIGGFFGLFFLLPSRSRIRKRWLRILQTMVVCLVVLQVYPVIVAFADEYIARQQFPVLSSFETPWEIERWNGSADYAIDDEVYHSGKHSLRVVLKTGLYSGVSLFYFPKNWEGAKRFHFSVYNPSAGLLPLTCRIHDQNHSRTQQLHTDRFNRKYSLAHGWSTIVIDIQDIRDAPAGRQMDLKHVQEVGIFATNLRQSRTIFIDDVGLD